jgi:hypothetical protein
MRNWWAAWPSDQNKTAASQREAAVRFAQAESSVEQILEGAGMIAGDAIDIGTRNAQIIELTIVESGELTDGLLVSGPLLESLANVHLEVSFRLRGYI